jgi:hypothetical protein
VAVPALTAGISALAASQTVATVTSKGLAVAMGILNVAMGPWALAISAIAAGILLVIAAIKNWDQVVAQFHETVAFVKEKWDQIWTAIQDKFRMVIDGIVNIYNSSLGWLLPGGALIKAFSFLKDNWRDLWDDMKAVVKSAVNPIAGAVNSMIGVINALFNALNNVSVGWEKKVLKGLPDIPAFGPWSPFNLPMMPQVPMMAKGGVVTRPTLAMLGEAGPEAVVPLGAGVGRKVTINVQLLGDTYGMDDFEERVAEAIRDGARRGGFEGILATG